MQSTALERLFTAIQNRVKHYGTQHYTFSIFAMLSYVVPLFISEMFDTLNTQLIVLRIIAVVLCFGLCLVDYWPSKWRILYLPIYWYIALCFCLPFLSTYTAFLTGGQEYWLLNIALSSLLLIMLVDWLVFIILTFLGALLSYLIYLLGDIFGINQINVYIPMHDIYFFAYLCAFVLLSVVLFVRQRETQQKNKLETMQVFGSAIAHEVNSPLSATRMLAMTLKDLTDNIILESKKIILNNGEERYQITLDSMDYMMLTETIPQGFERTSQEASKVVEILLMSLKDRFINQEKEYHISEVVKEAVNDYSIDQEQKDKIKMNLEGDFSFFGSKQMMKHVLYNLMRNAFKYGGPNIMISIWLSTNALHFHDDGQGIGEKDIKNIFKSFYTNSQTGTGIGLAFCNIVMKSIGGSIECRSELGEYTEFILKFPS